MSYQFHLSVVGGTFDRFHAGHRKLLTTAFEQSENVTIGIATVELYENKKLALLIEEYNDREKAVVQFLSDNGFTDRSEIIQINDIYGTSIDSDSIDAIFVTESTKPNALKINEERDKRGFKSLEIITVPFVLGDDGEMISSARIRKGLIDREGKSYSKLFERQEVYVLPEEARDEMRHPIGPVYTDMHEVISLLQPRTILIAVGDIVAASAQQAGRLAEINITDGKTRRQNLEPTRANSFSEMTRRTTENPAGTITQKAAKTIFAAISNYLTNHTEQLIDVNGEEDLLAIPAILLAPLSAVVIYGQFDRGIVVVDVTEHNKKRAQYLFGKFQ